MDVTIYRGIGSSIGTVDLQLVFLVGEKCNDSY
jgi:hypothetical protein